METKEKSKKMGEDSPSFKRKKIFYCNNCGGLGHRFEKCHYPILSMGIIAIRVDGLSADEDLQLRAHFAAEFRSSSKPIETDNCAEIRLEDILTDLKLVHAYKDRIRFLLIQRKHSLG